MQPTRQLIDAFRITADRIESGEYEFKWVLPESCYCGCLARTVMELNSVEAHETLYCMYSEPIWSKRASQQYCSTTGIRLDKVFQALYDVGLTSVEDFIELEFTGAIRPEQYHQIEYYEFQNKEYAINYFRTKADQLEKQLLSQQVLDTQVANKQQQVQTVTTQSVTVN